MRLTVIHHLVLATVLFTLILIGGILIVSHSAVINSIEDTGKKAAPHTAEKILAIIELEGRNLGKITYDWSVWDDTYQFIGDLNEAYIRSNLAYPTLEGLQLNEILFFDASGKLRYAISADLKEQRLREVPSDLIFYIQTHNLTGSFQERIGIIPLSSGPVLVATHPILHSDETGPEQGIVLIGRDLDDSWYREIENYLLYPFHMDSIQDILLNETFIDLDKTPYAIINQNGSSFTTISIVRDISGTPAYVASMDIPYQSPYNSLVLGSIGILVFVLSSLFFVIILLYYRYFFARNILALSSMLDGAASDEEIQKEISKSAPPEIAQLAKSAERITSTIRKHQTDLSCSRENLEEAEERWELIFEDALDPMCVGDEVGILSANRAFALLFGRNRIEFVNLPFQVLILPLLKDGTSPMESLMQQYYSIPDEGYTRFEWKILLHDQDMTFDVTIKRIRYRGKQLLFVAARDITAQARLHDLQATAIARIEKNLIQLGTLNDTIRNPLTVILGLLEEETPHHQERIIEQVRKIDAIIDQLDKGFLDSEKVRKYLKRYFEQGKR